MEQISLQCLISSNQRLNNRFTKIPESLTGALLKSSGAVLAHHWSHRCPQEATLQGWQRPLKAGINSCHLVGFWVVFQAVPLHFFSMWLGSTFSAQKKAYNWEYRSILPFTFQILVFQTHFLWGLASCLLLFFNPDCFQLCFSHPGSVTCFE